MDSRPEAKAATEKRVPPRFQLRLAAIPIVVTGLVVAAGLLTLAITTRLMSVAGSLSGIEFPADEKQRVIFIVTICVVLFGLVALVGGFVLAYLVTTPLRRLTQRAGALASRRLPGHAEDVTEGQDRAWDEAFEKVFNSLDSYILDSYTLDSMAGGVFTVSSEGTITSFNAVASKILGYDSDEVTGKRYTRALRASEDEQRAFFDMIEEALKTGRTFSSEETRVCTKDGRTITIGLTLSPLQDESGHSLGVVVTFKDLAELTRIRNQVLRAEHLASLGSLSAGIAHEIRNPLGSLLGLVDLLQEDMPSADPKREYTKTITRSIERMNKLVEDLLSFAQPAVSNPEPRDLNELVAEAVNFARYDAPSKNVTIKEEYAEDLPPTLADAEKFGQALLNIIRNAFEAVPEGGTISVTTAEGTRPAGEGDDTEVVVASFRNSGSYIPPERMERLFTPFFTTKSDGTGLGLSIAHQIVVAHAGQIEVESHPETGTTFRIEMPSAWASELAGRAESVPAGRVSE